MKTTFSYILFGNLLLVSIVCLVGCNQRSTPPSDAFWQAIKEGTIQDVRYYIEKEKVDVNAKDQDGMTPLHLAVVFNSDVEVMKYLIEKGADVNAKSNTGWTPFHIAAPMAIFSDDMVRKAIVLLENGADVNARNSEGKTPLDLIMALGTVVIKAGLPIIRKAAELGNPEADEMLQQLEKHHSSHK